MQLDIYSSVDLSKKLRLDEEASPYSNPRICVWKVEVVEDYLVKLRSNMDFIQHKSWDEESKLQTQVTSQTQNKNISEDDTFDAELGNGKSIFALRICGSFHLLFDLPILFRILLVNNCYL
jgi:hypothetical protein